ncbi:MAG: hypothetical protein VKL39_17880 [Leptolyngbyaceae bacterium]|nr:hypothetical protein [Leptolyngbyaceae bacterium]
MPTAVSSAELNRFAARYRLANAFNEISINGYPDNTVDAYSSVLRAFLAYSALEQFHKAVPPTPNSREHINSRWAHLATEHASKLRRSKTIVLFLIKQVQNQTLRDGLTAFLGSKSDNCLFVATALRHAVAHGVMSVHPNGTSPKTAARFGNVLAQMLLQIADQAFDDFFVSLDSNAYDRQS